MRFLIPFFLTLLCFQANADDSYLSTLHEIESSLPQSAPHIQDILPSFSNSRPSPPYVAIGIFSTECKSDIDWGEFASQMMILNLAMLPSQALDFGHITNKSRKLFALPETYDGKLPINLSTSAAVNRIAETSGAQFQIEGKWICIENESKISISVSDIKMGRNKQTVIKSSDPGEAYIQMLLWIYAALGLNSDQDIKYISNLKLGDAKLTRATAEVALKLSRNEAIELERNLIDFFESNPDQVHLGYLHLSSLRRIGDPATYNRHIDDISSHYAQNELIRYIANQLKVGFDFKSIHQRNETIIEQIENGVQIHLAMQSLIEGLAAESELYKAIRVALEMTRRWPEQFDSWLILAATLEATAWAHRGHETFAGTDSVNYQNYRTLIKLADAALIEAIKRQPSVPELHAMRIAFSDGYSSEAKFHFEKAISYDPAYYPAYSRILNFAAPKWGGSVIKQLYYFEIAEMNKLSEESLDSLFSQYISDEKYSAALIMRNLGLPIGHIYMATEPHFRKIFYSLMAMVILIISAYRASDFYHELRRRQIADQNSYIWDDVREIQRKHAENNEELIVHYANDGVDLPQLAMWFAIDVEDKIPVLVSNDGIISGNIEEAKTKMVNSILSRINVVGLPKKSPNPTI